MTFIAEIVFGCHDTNNVLSVLVDGFYLNEGKHCLKSDRALFTGESFFVDV